MEHLKFIDEHGSFSIRQPENTSYLYFPLASEMGLKSSVTPNLGGDAKIDQETFLLEPVSSENLHNNRSTRNFWVLKDGADAYSAAGASAEQESVKFTAMQDESELEAGFMWQAVTRKSGKYQIKVCDYLFYSKRLQCRNHVCNRAESFGSYAGINCLCRDSYLWAQCRQHPRPQECHIHAAQD